MKTEPVSEYDPMVAVNEALLLGSLRQHELTEAAEKLNEQLRREIDQRKEFEERLRVSETRYRRLFEVSQDGILILDSETGKITDANPTISRLLECDGPQIYGKELWEIGLFKDQEANRKAFLELKKNRVVHYENLPLITKAGHIQSVEFVSNLYQENGEAVIQCNLRDITRRRQVEQLLAEKARLIDLSNDAIIVRDLNNKISMWNKGAEKLFGWTWEETLGKDLHALLRTQFPKPIEEIIAQLHREGRFNGEVVQIARDGRKVRSLCGWVLDRDTESIFTSYTDITERTKIEAALRVSEGFNRSIIHSSPDCIKILDLDGILLSMESGHELLGIKDITPYLNKSWLNFWEGNDRSAAQAAIKLAAAGAQGNFIGFRHTMDGKPKWWNVAISPILGATHQPERLLAVSRDVTDGKKVEDALRESEERYRNLFNSMDEGFCVIEMIFDEHEKPVDWRFLEVNPSFGKLTGLHEAVGKRMRELVPDHEEYWFEIYGEVVRTGEPIRFSNEAKALSSWYDLYAFRIGGAGSRKVAVLFTNITEHRKSDEALDDARARLAEHAGQLEGMVTKRTAELFATNKQLEAFVYSIAHDLRAPLRSMQGFSEMLMEDTDSSLSVAGRDFADRINKSAQFLDALLQDLLAFSRVAQQGIELTSVDLETVIQPALSRLEDEIKEKKARVEVVGPWPFVLAHGATLGQVLINLLSNALKFSRPDAPTHIRLYTEEKAGFVRVWVEDNGIGIAPAHQGQIFGLFTRLHGNKFSGTGIGLAIVQKGIERLGGKVGLESTPGQGSRFWFELRKAEKI